MRYLTLLFCFLIVSSVMAQDEKISNINLQSGYIAELPSGDLSERYGANSHFEFRLEYLKNSSYAFFLKGGIRIGEQVNEDVLSSIRTENGFVLGVNGFYADVFGRKRGFDIGIGADKVFTVFKNDKFDHFLRIGGAVVRANHWIKLVDDSQAVPQILENYSELYDRYVSGWGIEENITFQYNTASNNAAFLIGIQCSQNFTKEHRAQYLKVGKANRLDLYFGVRAAYLLPLYGLSQGKTVYY